MFGLIHGMKAIFILVIVFAFSIGAFSQRVTLTGTVYDLTGSVVPKVRIVIIDRRGHSTVVTETQTSDEGVFEAALVPGEFTIRLESQGFKAFVSEKFRLVDTQKKKFFFDVVLESMSVDPCHDPTSCWPSSVIEMNKPEISTQISPINQKPNKR